MVGRGGGGWGVLLKQLCSGRSGPVPYTKGIWGGAGGRKGGSSNPAPSPPRSVPPLRSRLKVRDGRLVQAELLWTMGAEGGALHTRPLMLVWLLTWKTSPTKDLAEVAKPGKENTPDRLHIVVELLSQRKS